MLLSQHRSTVCLSLVFRDFCNCSSSLLIFIVTQEVITAWISLLTHLLVCHLFYSSPLACLTQVKVECATERAMQEWWRMARLLEWIGKDEKVRMGWWGGWGCRQRRQAAVAELQSARSVRKEQGDVQVKKWYLAKYSYDSLCNMKLLCYSAFPDCSCLWNQWAISFFSNLHLPKSPHSW